MSNRPIVYPSGYATAVAIGVKDPDGNMAIIDADNPLPVVFDASLAGPGGGGPPPTPSPALTGQATDGRIAGPFAAVPNLPIVVTLSGTWSGSVRVLRSIDGGATKVPLTVAGSEWALFTQNVCEQVWSETQADANFYLDIALQSGAVDYRLAQ